ncbi:MAG: YqgE/AlgH family protein [Rhodospirillales bacterium]|nr:YqgE/AlgH family protein [Rhodospirillales bacterium]MDE2318239.1 YqgE/AlgH family protein [Rhodospirillales bacterium]
MTEPEISVSPQPNWLTGQVLLAMPAMRDPRFSQSVIFICAHNEDGAMGLVLNRTLRKPKFGDLLQQLGVEPHPPQRNLAVGQGGPVEDHRGFVLHSAEWMTEGSLEVDGVHVLSASMEVLQAVASGGGPAQARLLLGYAGWGAGQLEEEICQNSWLTTNADNDIIFDSGYQTKWQRALAKLKIDPGMLSGDSGRA